MKIPATITKEELVSVLPDKATLALYKEWKLSIGLPYAVLKDGFWCRDDSVTHGHYELEKFTRIREITPSEHTIYNAFKVLLTIEWK